MVRINRIYTRSGDDGSTGLSDGSRRSKSDLRLESYGQVDELNSVLGLAISCMDEGSVEATLMKSIQNDLFDLGADLSTPGATDGLRVTAEQVASLETEIDRINADLSDLTSFILPGGTELASRLHVARTVCRRAERVTVSLAESEEIGPEVLSYLNRLSDLFFVMARAANDGGRSDILWVPGRNRP